ncbi:MAG TPA: hypothetical protein VHU82_08110 [Vicinamibacterales bacterium]|jgi:hypothetical protein|nr:hypothetical protein [Vicinamibacterales bacterium]
MAATNKKQTWIAVAVAALIILIVLGLALVGASAYLVSRHIHAQFTSSEAAEARLTSARERFGNQTPLIEIVEGGEPIVHHPPEGAPGAPITTLHALVYSTDTEKLVSVNVPMWLVKMLPSHERFRFIGDDVNVDSRRSQLTLEDLERHGPGLILDGRDHHGARVLVWAE